METTKIMIMTTMPTRKLTSQVQHCHKS